MYSVTSLPIAIWPEQKKDALGSNFEQPRLLAGSVKLHKYDLLFAFHLDATPPQYFMQRKSFSLSAIGSTLRCQIFQIWVLS